MEREIQKDPWVCPVCGESWPIVETRIAHPWQELRCVGPDQFEIVAEGDQYEEYCTNCGTSWKWDFCEYDLEVPERAGIGSGPYDIVTTE